MDNLMLGNLKEIQGLEDKYGSVVFGMGLTHLFDVGFSNINYTVAEEWIARITAKEETDRANCTHSFMSPEFQRAIVRCAAELAKYSHLTLFAYIKKHMHIGGV